MIINLIRLPLVFVALLFITVMPSFTHAALEDCPGNALGCYVPPISSSCTPTLYALTSSIQSGESASLIWSSGIFSTNDTKSITNYGSLPSSSYIGTVTVSPTQTTTYTMECIWTRTSYLGTTGGTAYSSPVTITVNQTPSKPTITGPTSGYTDTSYQFSFKSTDNDGDTVRFRIDWDNDGSTSDSPGGQVTSYVASGVASAQSQSWSTPGTYSFKAYAQDDNGLSSSPLWSDTFSITISDPTPACANGIDDDGDGLVDTADYGCSGSGDTSESPNPQCSDGIDNDSDGYTDYPNDPGCIAYTDTSESPNPQCSDGIDNDGNGLIDLEDAAGCSSSSDNNESTPEVESKVTFDVSPDIVRSGDTVSVSWSVTNVSSCTVAGSNGDSWSGTSGDEVSSGITSETTFVIACEETDGDSVSDSVTVKLVPTFQEVFRVLPQSIALVITAFIAPVQ